MKELKVGGKVTIKCVRTIISKPLICTKCFFYNMFPYCRKCCSADNRKDKRNVIFKEVKK